MCTADLLLRSREAAADTGGKTGNKNPAHRPKFARFLVHVELVGAYAGKLQTCTARKLRQGGFVPPNAAASRLWPYPTGKGRTLAITPSQLAVAAEALNRHPGLSATARRVGLELLNHVNRTTGTAWPSEARMAEALSLSARSIRRAKAELAALGLITWQRRGTSKAGRTNLYSLAWDALLSLAARIKAKVKDAATAARNRLRTIPAAAPPPTSNHSNGGPRTFVDRTKVAAYLSQGFKFSSGKGFWKAPDTPQGQHLTDQQLDGKAQARVYEALRQLGQAALAQFLARPDAAQLEAAAIKAERYSQGTALAFLAAQLRHEVTA